MKKYRIIIYILFLAIGMGACKKHPFDVRNKYLGAWDFRVRNRGFLMYDSVWDQTYWYQGEIQYGEKLYELEINYGKDLYKTIKINDDGTIACAPTAYGYKGEFVRNDSLHLKTDSGGLGCHNYQTIDGVKK